MGAICPVCGSNEWETVLSLPAVPVLANARVRPEEAEDVPRGDIDLAVCRRCGHLFNASFDSGLLDYDAAYENTLHFSASFRDYAGPLAERLVADHDLAGARVAELGSGPGHFLSLLCEVGVGEAFGFDPSYAPDRLGAPENDSVTISTERFPSDGSLEVPFALSQHVLEHLEHPVDALVVMRTAVARNDGCVYTEVPNGQLMLDRCALWDLIYEHVSYFVPSSLEVACHRAGLDVTAMATAFGEQFLWAEAHPSPADPDAAADPDVATAAVTAARAFGTAAKRRIVEARDELARWAAEGPVVLWGAGSKGVTYLNLVADAAPLAGVIDINPRKTGWGLPGTSCVIGGPEAVEELQPRTVLAANPIYIEEIRADLARFGVDAQVRPLWD